MRAEEPVSGFSTEGTGVLTGEVVTEAGAPVAGAKVEASTPDGPVTTTTDAQGRYRLDLGAEPGAKYVFVRQKARISGRTSRSTVEDGEEAVEILEADKPQIMPKPRQATNLIPEYTQAARDANVWARAWLVLDVDGKGRVTRLKLLDAPGYGLDDIAIREAFKLRFEPARTRAGATARAMVLWTYEWPAYWWMFDNKLPLQVVPEKALGVPCQGTPARAAVLRNCAQATVARVQQVEWRDAPAEVLSSVPVAPVPEILAPAPPAPARWYHDRGGWWLAGAGGVVLWGGIAYLIAAERADDEADGLSEFPLRQEQKREQADHRRLYGAVFSAVGVAVLGAGVAKLMIHSDGTKTSVAVAGRF